MCPYVWSGRVGYDYIHKKMFKSFVFTCTIMTAAKQQNESLPVKAASPEKFGPLSFLLNAEMSIFLEERWYPRVFDLLFALFLPCSFICCADSWEPCRLWALLIVQEEIKLLSLEAKFSQLRLHVWDVSRCHFFLDSDDWLPVLQTSDLRPPQLLLSSEHHKLWDGVAWLASSGSTNFFLAHVASWWPAAPPLVLWSPSWVSSSRFMWNRK